jgi:exosortase A-associated hydrolase 2
VATPFFINGSQGRLFALYYPPLSGEPDVLVLHLPAFGEEMNKSRRMVALQSIELSQNNVGVLVVDLFGTGDSEGLLENATWQTWLDDIDAAIEWLKQQHSDIPLYLWGLRFGGALAASYATQGSTKIQGLLLWQPLLSGKMMLNQFLRLRVASAMTSQSSAGKPTETTKSLLQDLAEGSAVEVGGYLLSPELSASILTVEIDRFLFTLPLTILWLDFVSGEAVKPSPASDKVINLWTQQKIVVNWAAINGDRFWSTQEIAVCPELIVKTTQMLCTSNA